MIELRGTENYVEIMDKLTKDFPEKIALSGIRSALLPFKKNLSRRFDNEEGSLTSGYGKYVRFQSKKTGKGRITSVGLSAKKAPKKLLSPDRKRKSSEGYFPAYTLVYWAEYGTLKGRDPNHHFGKGPGSNSKNPKGIKYGHIIESEWVKDEALVISSIPKKCSIAMERYLKRLEKKQQMNNRT